MARRSCSESPGSPARCQNETRKAFIRSRWMPAGVDAIECGKFGRANVTATPLGDIDTRCTAISKQGSRALLAASENTLRHWAGGHSSNGIQQPHPECNEDGRGGSAGEHRNPDLL